MGFVLPDIAIENRLMSQAASGNKTAIEEIYNQYFPSIYRFIRLHIDDEQQAEDIASDVFIKFMDTVGTFRGPHQSLRGWLFKVARNEVNHHYGKIRRFPMTALEEWLQEPDLESDDLETQFIRSVTVERTREALKMLARDQQEVLILRFAEALDLQTTAEVMGKSISAIKSLQFRAVDTLRRILGEQKKHG
ncbi:MAG: sigma-70 family RNA polymerase sigma factor [Chloroflexota bacterium]